MASAEVVRTENINEISVVDELNPFCFEAAKGIGAEAFVRMQQHLQIGRESSNGLGWATRSPVMGSITPQSSNVWQRTVPYQNHPHWEVLRQRVSKWKPGFFRRREFSHPLHSSSTNLGGFFLLWNGCIRWRHYKGICKFVRFPRNVSGRSLSGTFSGDWNNCTLYAYVYPVNW